MSIVRAEGPALPFDHNGVSYPAFGSRVPALNSFYLGFDVGDASPGDHEVALMQVLAGGEAEDLSTGADLAPTDIPDGRLHVTIQDANARGERFHYNIAHALLRAPGARRYQVRDVGCVDKCSRPLPQEIFQSSPLHPGVSRPLIALVGFKLFFTGARDHDLDRVGVWFDDTDLHVVLRDKNGDDTFGYLVDFVVIPTAGMNATTGVKRGTARGGERVELPTPSHMDFFLTGWAFNYHESDHEIRDIGVVHSGDAFTVFYSDKNADDLFDWRVEWAQFGPMVVSPQSVSSAS